jgi:hypothetical protein
MTKYIAFLDVLGYKNKINLAKNQADAISLINSISDVINGVFEKKDHNLESIFVSDSLIINTIDASLASLKSLLEIIDEICKQEFLQNDIFLRGAVTKGEFDNVSNKVSNGFTKVGIVGSAYIEAYMLESETITIGIALSSQVYDDINEYGLFADTGKVTTEKNNGDEIKVFIYLDLKFLRIRENLKKFVEIAKDSEWKHHYYNTLYFAMKNKGSNIKDIRLLFEDIFAEIHEGNPSTNYNLINSFIKNAFEPNVIAHFQDRLLKHLREKWFD